MLHRVPVATPDDDTDDQHRDRRRQDLQGRQGTAGGQPAREEGNSRHRDERGTEGKSTVAPQALQGAQLAIDVHDRVEREWFHGSTPPSRVGRAFGRATPLTTTPNANGTC